MNASTKLAVGLIRKAESDLMNMQICLNAASALDTVCFHAQQVAEKYLKAYLAAYDIDYPFIHNLPHLIKLCAERDESFVAILELSGKLTNYAVTIRYDDDFWPVFSEAQDAVKYAETIKNHVIERLPNDVISNLSQQYLDPIEAL